MRTTGAKNSSKLQQAFGEIHMTHLPGSKRGKNEQITTSYRVHQNLFTNLVKAKVNDQHHLMCDRYESAGSGKVLSQYNIK